MVNQALKSIQYARKNRTRFLNELMEVLRIPSVSTDPKHQVDMNKAAEWFASALRKMGADHVQIFSTAKHPVVYGDFLKAVSPAPTILIYGHYDVQPADPLELWQNDPFDPVQINDNLFGRGVSDMKGQVIASLKAVEAIISQGPLPVNIKFLIEGEEEIGSPSLTEFLRTYKELLACDIAINPDAGMIGVNKPTIVYSLRGLAYFELRIFGPAHDLHSGLFGGIVHNPAQVLCDLIAGMHDTSGRVTLPGFYDDVRSISSEERKELSHLPLTDHDYLEQTGAPKLWGEIGYTPVERIGARPTLEVNGILSGFTGEGSKTVIPQCAMAKISMRLVPDQNPNEVHKQLLEYLNFHTPDTIKYELIPMASGPACIVDRNLPAVRALSSALQTTWKVTPVFQRGGGSIPVVADMQKILGVESVLTGFGLPDDNVHSPNEKIHLPTWYLGIEALIRFIYNLGGV